MPLWKITLSYDGTRFHGWQIQPGLPTVQGTVAAALERITGERCLPQGSGRTDAGVHALGQVASVALASPIPPANLKRALNGLLPASVRVLAAEPQQPPFHARHSARAKTYEYRIFPRRPVTTGSSLAPPRACVEPGLCDPMRAPYVWDCPLALDLGALNAAAAAVCGTHDFTSFAATGSTSYETNHEPGEPMPDHSAAPATPCRTVTQSRWSMREDLLVYQVTGSGFLHHMVRNLVGTFVLAGAGRLAPDAIPRILAARARSAAGPTAPARGLFLLSVEY